MQRPGKGSQKTMVWDIPGGPVVKNLPTNAGDKVLSWSGKIPRATGQPSPCVAITKAML